MEAQKQEKSAPRSAAAKKSPTKKPMIKKVTSTHKAKAKQSRKPDAPRFFEYTCKSPGSCPLESQQARLAQLRAARPGTYVSAASANVHCEDPIQCQASALPHLLKFCAEKKFTDHQFQGSAPRTLQCRGEGRPCSAQFDFGRRGPEVRRRKER